MTRFKLTPLSNQWLLYQQISGKYKKVGKIKPQPNNITLITVNDTHAGLKTKQMENQTIYHLTSAQMNLKGQFSSPGSRTILIWKLIPTNENILKVTTKNSRIVIHYKNSQIANVHSLSNSKIVEIIDEISITPLIILASLYPFL
ncbi:MAG: hypothetical protein ACTSSH_10870 [Candidatus Heimdallarchaeota archaeon]